MLSVAIALEPPTQSVAAVEAIAQSCERAIGAGRCRVAADVPSTSVVTWYAVVIIDLESSALSIQFRDRNASGAPIETRELAFSERDSSASRWASAGAVIAAFVAARDSAAEPPPPPPPPAPVVLPPPLPAPPSWAWNVDLALFSGAALDDDVYRWGALGRGYVALPQAPAVLGLVSLRYSERPGDLSLVWWSASCGLGARARAAAFSAELTGEVAFERLQIHAESGPDTDQVSQNRFGGRLSVNLALGFSEHLALVGGAEVTAMRPSISISVGDADVGRVPAVGYGFSAGLRFGYGD